MQGCNAEHHGSLTLILLILIFRDKGVSSFPKDVVVGVLHLLLCTPATPFGLSRSTDWLFSEGYDHQ
jgi:hypothetical protein